MPEQPKGKRTGSPLFHEVRFPDGSLRAVRKVSRRERERRQAFSDWFGAEEVLAPESNTRTMDSILASLLEKMDLSVAEFAPEVLARAWREAAGPFLAEQAELLSIANQRARIRTSHPAVRYELQRLKHQIVRRLNATLGAGSVKSVQVVHG